MTPRRLLLVIEDGTEYTEALARLAPRDVEAPELVRAGNVAEARERLAERKPDGILLDVVFDRVPTESLAGDLPGLIARFGGDRARATRHLAESQGFYILDALAGELGYVPVVLAYDFSGEPQRLEALRRRVPRLSGLPEGASISQALEILLERTTRDHRVS